jgi:hypothetical protein
VTEAQALIVAADDEPGLGRNHEFQDRVIIWIVLDDGERFGWMQASS